MSLQTPEAIRTLPRKLYREAKAEPTFRFYLLYDKVWRSDCLRDARQERFDFLGYSFGPDCFRQQGRWYTGASPSKKSVQRLKDKVSAILGPGNKGAWEEVRDTLTRLLRGWCGCFSPGSHYATDRVIEAHLYDRVRNFLARRHKLPTRGTRHIRKDDLFGTLGVPRLRFCRTPGATS